MYKYFVSFKCDAGDGNGVLEVNYKITGNKDLRNMEKFICEEKFMEMVTINNFILLEVTPDER